MNGRQRLVSWLFLLYCAFGRELSEIHVASCNRNQFGNIANHIRLGRKDQFAISELAFIYLYMLTQIACTVIYYAALLFIYAPAYANERIIREYLPLWDRYAHSAPCDSLSLLLTVLAFILPPAACEASWFLHSFFSSGRSCSPAIQPQVFSRGRFCASFRKTGIPGGRARELRYFALSLRARLIRLTARSPFNFMHNDLHSRFATRAFCERAAAPLSFPHVWNEHRENRQLNNLNIWREHEETSSLQLLRITYVFVEIFLLFIFYEWPLYH